mmetsp:Transcript_43765/g.133187  ORF Transcript_43765/g.133187 Transcript_43765/m.133187 type:complete len:467 (-) Transcript_43765:191-1591(-)
MVERKERAAPRGAVVPALMLALGLMVVLCFSEMQFSALRFSGMVSTGSVIGPASHRRRLQDDVDLDGEEDPMEEGEEASESFDPDEDAGVEGEIEEMQRSAEPVDVEKEFERVNNKAEDESLFALQEMKMRLRPRPPLDLTHIKGPNSNATKQFAHLHHMKTGGTSINRVVSCAVSRARNGDREALPFSSLSECGWNRYMQCTEGTDERANKCREQINSSAVMQYCSPLFQMDRFGWLDGTDVITTLRNPVGRVWSMFRFQTRMCYHCTPLVEVYKMIDDGTIDDWCDEQRASSRRSSPGKEGEKKGCEGVCMSQLLNHQTRNLMTTQWESPEGMAMSDEDKLNEALHNLQNNIAVVGITEDLPTYRDILGEVFPWLAENAVANPEVDTKVSKLSSEVPKTCSLPHANASPGNNHCGKDGKSHWDLPNEPDKETLQAILKHNQLDIKLYEAAKKKFQLQKRALGLK